MGLMTASGGLTKRKLALADAVPEDVVAPKSFYAGGSKDLKTGTLAEQPGVVDAQSITVYNDQLYYRFPFGAYRTQIGATGCSEARSSAASVISTLGVFREVGVAVLVGGAYAHVAIMKAGQTAQTGGNNYSGDYVRVQFYQYGNTNDYIAAYARKAGRYLVVTNNSVSTVTAIANQQLARLVYGQNFIMVAALF